MVAFPLRFLYSLVWSEKFHRSTSVNIDIVVDFSDTRACLDELIQLILVRRKKNIRGRQMEEKAAQLFLLERQAKLKSLVNNANSGLRWRL